MDGYLTKPIEVERLRSVLTKYGLEQADDDGMREAAAAGTGPLENSAAPVDLGEFHSITDGDAVFAQELIAAFITSGEQQLSEIAAAIAQNNRNVLSKAAHKFKGASANLHARALKCLAEQLETDSVAADAQVLQQGNERLRREFDRVKEFLADPSVVPHPSKAAS
jgi:HPt (histidine-containing phosphotransfer) domain-containing protein